MDISAYLASVQDNPQSAALAKNIMQPGIPSPDGSSAPDAGSAPQPESWADQAQQDTGPVTGGFDQAQMGMDDAPMAPDGSDNLDQGMQSFNDQPPEDQSQDQGYARGGMVRPPRVPRVKMPKARQPKAGGGGQNGGLFSPSTRRGGPGEDPSTNLPEDAISPIGMYDKAGNLHGISDIGITKAELGQGGPQQYANAGMWGDAGPAGDSSGGLAEGGSVDELPDDKGDDQYARLPGSENVDDRRRDVITPQQYAGMSAHEQAMASNYPGGPGDDMLAGSKRLLKGPMKFDEGGDVEDPLAAAGPAIPLPVEETERGEEMSGEMDQEKPMGFRERMGAAIGMHGRGMQEAVAAGFKKIYADAGVNAGMPTPQVQHSAEQMFKGKGATPAPQAEAAIEANEGNSGKAVEAVSNFYGGKSTDPSQYETLSPVKQMGIDKPGPDAGPGAQAAAGLIQHIRTVWNKASAIASAAADGGNLPKAAEALETGLNKIPDGTQVKVTPTQGGVDVNVDGKSTPLTPQQMHHIAATPFDVIAHMGVPQTIANLQNVQQLQHMSGQPQQVPASINTQQAEAVKARMAQQDAQFPPEGPSPVDRPPASRNPNVPGADEPITIVRGGGAPTRGGSAYTPTTVQRVNRETGQDIEPRPVDPGNARIMQERIRQQGLNTRAADSASSPHGREAQLKMQRERQAQKAADAEIKEAADAGKPVDRGTVYKKWGLEHLTQGGNQAAPAAGAAPKDGEIRVINGRKMRADVKKGGWVPAE